MHGNPAFVKHRAEVKAKQAFLRVCEEGARADEACVHLRPVVSNLILVEGGEPKPSDPSRSIAAGTRKVVIFARAV